MARGPGRPVGDRPARGPGAAAGHSGSGTSPGGQRRRAGVRQADGGSNSRSGLSLGLNPGVRGVQLDRADPERPGRHEPDRRPQRHLVLQSSVRGERLRVGGFVRDLPLELIDAFHSTLAETVHADLILHVIDIDDLDREWKIEVVNDVLKKIGCEKKKMIYVFNKIDLMQFDQFEALSKEYEMYSPVSVSAQEKINLEELKGKISESLI